MAQEQEQTVRCEVHERKVETSPSEQPERLERETHVTETHTRQVVPAPPAPAGGVTNVNVTPGTAGGAEETVATGEQVSVTTPEGTQINVNT